MIEPDPSAPASAGEAPTDVPPAGSPAGEAAGDEAAGGVASFGYRDVPRAEKAGLVRGVFESVAPRYDLMNDLMSGGVHRLWKNALVDVVNPRPGEKLLDVAGGTGDIAFRLARRVAERGGEGAAADVTICDINSAMLGVGRDRAIDRGLLRGLAWTTGDAEHLPFPDRSFDAYTIAFGLRNVTDIDQALREAYRVLKPGGRYYCLEFSKVTSAPIGRVYDAYSERALPFFGRMVARDAESYRYLHESIRRFPPQHELAARLGRAGFARVAWRNMTLGVVALHSGWRI
ncbi:MAG: bifunctional demethylmenaquinone methyltransferase/2-methoxy-6-polyprenyl-1,4-benzoquinol methylase UbiE [Proteobacteria bacterium]|nr:bifunctional demethylmenaquinone methyltransferase/2-methoxy-6-polyprenyl-1,4-benzoquinol methylase UbiE [Pseudomonadota bacterium]